MSGPLRHIESTVRLLCAADEIAMSGLAQIAVYLRDHHDPLWEEHAKAIGEILIDVHQRHVVVLEEAARVGE